MENKLDLIQISLEEKLNTMHKEIGESLNSRQILNDFILKMNLEFDQLKTDLKNDH